MLVSLFTDLRRVEDDVEFADVLKVAVERLDQHLDQVQDAQLALRRFCCDVGVITRLSDSLAGLPSTWAVTVAATIR